MDIVSSARNIIQSFTVGVILYGIIQLIGNRKVYFHRKQWLWVLPIFTLAMHTLMFYFAVFSSKLYESPPVDVINTWSSIVRLHSALTFLNYIGLLSRDKDWKRIYDPK
jgi:hypothetical protein